MSSSFIASLNFARQQLVRYGGIPIFSLGIIGGCLNVIIFLSLKTFRQSSCAFYLMMTSVADVGQLCGTILGYIMRWGFGIDWGASSFV